MRAAEMDGERIGRKRGATKERGSDYLSFFYLTTSAHPARFAGRVFSGRTLSLSVHPSTLPYRETAGWTTNGRPACACSAARRRVG